jgi:hypothetical protein
MAQRSGTSGSTFNSTRLPFSTSDTAIASPSPITVGIFADQCLRHVARRAASGAKRHTASSVHGAVPPLSSSQRLSFRSRLLGNLTCLPAVHRQLPKTFPGSFVGLNGERGNVHRVRSSSPSDERYRYVPDQRLGQVRFGVSSIFVKFDKIRSFLVFWGIGSACVSFTVSGARCLGQERTRGHEVWTGSFPRG